MFRRKYVSLVLLSAVLLLLAYQSAEASVVGKWRVRGRGCQTLIIDGYPPETMNYRIRDRLVFRANHRFASSMYRGTWKQESYGFSVDVRRSIRKFVEDYFADAGIAASLTITSYSFIGSEGSGKINVEVNLTGRIHVTYPEELHATFSLEESASGSRINRTSRESDAEYEDPFDDMEQFGLLEHLLNDMLDILPSAGVGQ